MPPHTAHLPAGTRSVLLVLHGGRAESLARQPRLGLARLRMRAFGAAVRRLAADPSLAEVEVRYRYRGWNGGHAHPVADAALVLREIAFRAPDVKVVLLGHSMGGRAALAVAGHPQVLGAVLLAPWCQPGDPVGQLRGRRFVILHDPSDRVTSAEGSRAFAARARRAGAEVRFVEMPRGGHAMVSGAGAWQRLAARSVTAILEGEPLPDLPPGTS
ncbi:alpha/beta fold hydrolase [Kitasatospora cineracea]|uniref:Serine aminopeptidase S33 family n=1 Tax=Kitasatospora cineracea TaxID=88074 RepID=A0A8G1XGP2_9ACTN|nr:alpha/beta fold hydrolase [Kitasatospora cineracea]ROR46972.1 serine aminopeptidase S33 family [Kitasatospora cineracea]